MLRYRRPQKTEVIFQTEKSCNMSSSYTSIAFSFPLSVGQVPLRVRTAPDPVCTNIPVASLGDSTSVCATPTISRRAFLMFATATATEAYLSRRPVRAEKEVSSAFTLPPLPYAYDALEPHISSQIMHAHHDAHFATYVEKLNKAISQLPSSVSVSSDDQLVAVLGSLNSIKDDSLRTAVRNNGGGYLNHKLFFSQMAASSSQLPDDALLALAIRRKFGSFDDFKTEFLSKATGLFGSGFTWLVKERDGTVDIIQTPNQDNPAMQNLKPVLACDCWEHSWYYQYGPKKKDYLTSWWKVVNWSEVNDIFVKA